MPSGSRRGVVAAMMRLCFLALLLTSAGQAQTAANVLLIVNHSSEISRHIADYYSRKRAIPAANLCRVRTADVENIDWATYQSQIETPVRTCLQKGNLTEKILYMVTTLGLPLKVGGAGSGASAEYAAVDSELTLLYQKIHGKTLTRAGPLHNPLFQEPRLPFRHPDFPIYLVTRLAGYDFDDVKGLVDRALEARNRGKFVFDLTSDDESPGNRWLRMAALALPQNRVVLEQTDKVLYGEKDVIAYAGWGSNDKSRHERRLRFQWLPGAIMTEFVSTNGRSFKRPPPDWNISSWSNSDQPRWFVGSPQTIIGDYIHEGVTGCSGHVEEPFLTGTPRPDYLIPAYASGRNLAESYYIAIPGLSWQNIVIGDPLCAIGAK
jgi:uncharacterized protein (TIGR03790 family)